MPPEHPARDMQDTLYLGAAAARAAVGRGRRPHAAGPTADATLLRTHTSAMQIRYMETHQPPVRIIAPGPRLPPRQPRPHAHADVPAGRGARRRRGRHDGATSRARSSRSCASSSTPDTRVLFRPSFFPYTEPSAEVCIGCVVCGGAGCPSASAPAGSRSSAAAWCTRRCSRPSATTPERYTGFAFGMGIERVAHADYGVDDIRLFYENDLRFLEQFPV